MRGIGILARHNISYIDHLVPLCQILSIPILVTEPWIGQLIDLYYPPMEVVVAEPEDHCLDPYLEGYDLFVYVDFYRKPTGFQFVDYYTHKKARSLYSFHGQPDKWEEIYWLEKLLDEDLVLLYGPRMLEVLKRKGIDKKGIICGNYRLAFYLEHKAFFDAKIPFKKHAETVLYAPTWDASNQKSEYRYNYSTFFSQHAEIFEKYSRNSQLIVKLHPNLLRLMDGKVEEVKETFPDIEFLDDFPLIYPLLQKIDRYVGDYSSVGYDFLYFDKPMELLGSASTYLKQTLEKPRKEVYNHIFGEIKPLKQLREEICASIS